MKKIIASVLILASLILTLGSCSQADGVPAGMQLVRGGDAVGYKLFAPSEWTVSNLGDIARAHISSVDTTSVSLVEIAPPTDDPNTSYPAAVDYFLSDVDNFPFPIDLTVTADDEVILGNAEQAYKFVFEFKIADLKYKCMQIIASYAGRYFIFTYQSSNELMSDKTYYDFYYDKVVLIMDELVFTDKLPGASVPPSDPDGDGYYLASNKDLCGFDLYLPLDYACEFSEGMVSASVSPTANVSLVKATGTGVSVADYYNQRKTVLESISEDFTEIEIGKTEGVKLGNLTTAASYEYTYAYNGTTYHVYQIMAVDTFNGYVFTYTATEDTYTDALETVKTIIEKAVF